MPPAVAGLCPPTLFRLVAWVRRCLLRARRHWAVALAAALLLVALGSPQHYRDTVHTANESARIYAAEALVRFGSPSLNPVFDGYFPGWRDRRRPPNVDVSVRDGHFLLDKAPGVTLAATPVVALLDGLGIRPTYRQLAWLLAFLLCCIPTVLALLGLRRWLRAETDPVAAALAIALGLASPWTVYAGLLFGHALAAALVTAGTLLSLGALRPPPAAPSDGARPHGGAGLGRSPLLGGLALGGAVLADYVAAWVVGVVLAALLADPTRRRRAGWVVLGGLAPALALATWNQVLFGSPAHFSYAYKWNPTLATTHGHGLFGIGLPSVAGLWGLLGSARRGLLSWAPWLSLGVLGVLWAGLDRRLGLAWRLTLGLAPLGALLLISGFPDWHGGRALGPRYLLCVLPLWGIAAAWSLHRLRQHPFAYRSVLAILLGLMASSAILSFAASTGYVYVSHRVANPLFEVVIPVLLHDGFGPTIWDGLLGRPGGALLVLAAAAGAAAVAWPRRSHDGGQPSEDEPLDSPPEDDALDSRQRRASAETPMKTHPAFWHLALLALAAAVIHLSVASLPTTAGASGLRRVRHERVLAKEMLNLETGPTLPAVPRRPPVYPGTAP